MRIGGTDNPVAKNPLEVQPYIPGAGRAFEAPPSSINNL